MPELNNGPQEEPRRREFGFPDFWPVVEAGYPRFVEVGPKALAAMHSVADRAYPEPEPHQRVILNLSMLAGISFVEVVTLTVNGLGHGAMKILRSLLETSINTEYFRLRPAEFEDYREWYHVERFKEMEYLREHANAIFQQLAPEAVTEIENSFTRVRPRFQRADGSVRRFWCSLDLAARSAVTGHQESYRLINPLASSFVHETMYGLMRHFDAARDVHRVEVPPTFDWAKESLSGSQHCMVRVVRTLSETFNVASNPPVEELEQDWHYAWAEAR